MNWAKQHKTTGGGLVIDWESLHGRFKPENGRENAEDSDALANDSGLSKNARTVKSN
jgi:hypothetical protein